MVKNPNDAPRTNEHLLVQVFSSISGFKGRPGAGWDAYADAFDAGMGSGRLPCRLAEVAAPLEMMPVIPCVVRRRGRNPLERVLSEYPKCICTDCVLRGSEALWLCARMDPEDGEDGDFVSIAQDWLGRMDPSRARIVMGMQKAFGIVAAPVEVFFHGRER
jgi:hypothetical protein